MTASRRHCLLTAFSLLTASLVLDQWSKSVLLQMVGGPNDEPIVVTWFFNLVMVWNQGMSFGMFAGPGSLYVLIGIAAIILTILFIWLFRTNSLLISSAIGLIAGGAIGNVIDRLRFGAVADFFDLHIAGYHWPAFNIADSTIFIGVVLLCWDSMFGSRNSQEKEVKETLQ